MPLFPLTAYPISLNSSDSFYRWFESLELAPPARQLFGKKLELREPTRCECCGEQEDTYGHTDPSVNQMLQLPCGCKMLEWCVDRYSGLVRNELYCPGCGFHLFHWPYMNNSPEYYLESLDVVKVEDMDEEDRCCGICHEDFCGDDLDAIFQRWGEAVKNATDMKDVPIEEYPVRLEPCKHIFGSECIRSWLDAAPHGAGSNTCPACRQELFQIPNEEDIEEGEREDGEDEEEGWLAVLEPFRQLESAGEGTQSS